MLKNQLDQSILETFNNFIINIKRIFRLEVIIYTCSVIFELSGACLRYKLKSQAYLDKINKFKTRVKVYFTKKKNRKKYIVKKPDNVQYVFNLDFIFICKWCTD